MKETPKILFRIALVVIGYLLIIQLIFWSTGASSNTEHSKVRPYYGEIEQAENDFVNSELEKLNDK